MTNLALKGLAKVKKTLANGGLIYYCYAWRGGPLLRAPNGQPLQPGDSALHLAFEEAHECRRNPQTRDLSMLIREFRKSSDFANLSASSRENYGRYLDDIWRKFGRLSLVELEKKETRGKFKAWRDTMADRPRTADYAWTTLARVLSFAKDRGLLSVNVAERGGRLYRADRRDKIWSEQDVARFIFHAPAQMTVALTMALWTGQRQGDLLRTRWSAYDGNALRIRQSKTGARVVIPVGAPLKAALGQPANPATTILTNTRGNTWTLDGFRSSWRRYCMAAGITGLTFHDLRGTAVTRLALAGCTVAEIAAIPAIRCATSTRYLMHITWAGSWSWRSARLRSWRCPYTPIGRLDRSTT